MPLTYPILGDLWPYTEAAVPPNWQACRWTYFFRSQEKFNQGGAMDADQGQGRGPAIQPGAATAGNAGKEELLSISKSTVAMAQIASRQIAALGRQNATEKNFGKILGNTFLKSIGPPGKPGQP